MTQPKKKPVKHLDQDAPSGLDLQKVGAIHVKAGWGR